MVEMARFIKPILSIVPPDPGRTDPREWLPLVGLARRFRKLPEQQQSVFVQLMTMSAADFLDQWFETDPLKATMAASGIIGTFQGVRSPGTAYVVSGPGAEDVGQLIGRVGGDRLEVVGRLEVPVSELTLVREQGLTALLA